MACHDILAFLTFNGRLAIAVPPTRSLSVHVLWTAYTLHIKLAMVLYGVDMHMFTQLVLMLQLFQGRTLPKGPK